MIINKIKLLLLFYHILSTYLLLIEFEVRNVKYGPSFFPSIYGPSAKRAGHKLMGKKRGSIFYSTDRENEVNKIFIISLILEKRNPFKSIAATFE